MKLLYKFGILNNDPLPSTKLVEFVESMQTKDLQKFKEFFETIPKIEKNISFKCPKCKYEEDVHVEGIESFFG